MPSLINDQDSTALAEFAMQKNHNPHDETIAASSFEEALLGSNSSACVHEFPYDHHCRVQREHVYSNDNGDMECLPDMWENWLNIPSELQTLDMNELFHVPSSGYNISTSPNFSSQTSANSLQSSHRRIPAALKTSPLPSDASPYATNEHNLHSLYENNPIHEHLDTSKGRLMAPYPPPLQLRLMVPVIPPPPKLKGSHKMKTAGNFRKNGARKNEEAKTFLVESIEDGYVWYKYGQKSIKNRSHPRGYFKCAHPNCPVKKQSESSSDVQGFLLLTYFGEHNHSSQPRCQA